MKSKEYAIFMRGYEVGCKIRRQFEILYLLFLMTLILDGVILWLLFKAC